MEDLFSESDLDQEKLEKERELEQQKLDEKIKKEKEERSTKSEKSYDKVLYIIDGYSLIYRSYFAFLTRPLTDRRGNNISAYYGFFNTLLSLMSQYRMDYLAVCMDEKEETFRHKMYPEYKANRMKAPEDLHAQVPLIRETLDKMGVAVLSKAGFEADDVIASLTCVAEKKGIRSVMFTGDKDLLQLVSPAVSALRPPKKGETGYAFFTSREVYENFSVRPEQIIDYLSLLGDSSDNVPGVKGIGEKGAVKLLSEYVSLDGIYRNLEHISASTRKRLEEGRNMAFLSRELVTLSFDALDDTFNLDELETARINKENARPDFTSFSLKSLLRKLGKGEADEPVENEDDEIKSESAIREDELFYQGEGKYECLLDISRIEKKFEDCITFHDGIMAFDTETTGFEDDAEILGFSFSYELKKAYYCPLFAGGNEYLKRDEVKALFDKYFKSGKIRTVGQNLKYDLKILWNLGSDISNIEFDTMIAAWMVESNQAQFNLEALSRRFIAYEMLPFEDVVEKGKGFESVSLEDATRYSAEDADITLRLYYILLKRLIENEMLDTFRAIELPLIRVLASMERKGIQISDAKMEDLKKETDEKVRKLEQRIFDLAGHDFNLNSTQQLAKVLFSEMGLEAGKKTHRGYSTDSATLEMLRKNGGGEIVERILDYRMLSKLKSTYIDVLPTLKGSDGRIHTSFLQTGTATGRLSSRNPNLQNIPVRTDEGRLIRSAFVPRAGNIFISADYSQIELVVLAHMAGDEELRKAFINGIDVHRYTASLIFNKDIESISHSERQIAKTINFGIMYGMSAFRLSNELSITRKDAQQFIDLYFERYSGIRSFVDSTVKSAEEKGYVETLFHHRRHIQGINSKNKTEKNAAERVAVNTVIQGSASEIMKRAMIALSDRDKSYLVLQVHDELIFECPISEMEDVERSVKSIMENTTELSIPVRASVEHGECWGDMH